MKKKRVMAGILVGALAVGGHQVWAATVHYNDSSVTGGVQNGRRGPDSGGASTVSVGKRVVLARTSAGWSYSSMIDKIKWYE